MSDYDRNKYFPKKKSYQNVYRENSNTFGSRFFSKSAPPSKFNKDAKENERDETKVKIIQQPTILLNKNRSTSERPTSPKKHLKENESSITIAVPHDISESTSTHIPSMTKSAKLLEDGVIRVENVQEFLQDTHDFLVVGVLGGQGVGKSTILNLIAHKQLTPDLKNNIFKFSSKQKSSGSEESIKILVDNASNLKVNDSQTQSNEPEEIIFKPQSFYQIESGDCGTNGIDMFVTSNRLILLDCQPIVSSAILDELTHTDNKRSSVAGEFLPLENLAEIQALQMATFLISVCHILIFVQDWFFDSNALRFIQTAEMLKPTLPSNEEELVDHFPHLIMLQNRATMEDFTPTRFKTMQEIYKIAFRNSKLRLDSKAGLNTGRMAKELCLDHCIDSFNLFLIPEFTEGEKQKYKGHPDLQDLILKLQGRIHGATKFPLTHIQLTEKNWLQYAVKVWDHVKKSSFFVEYTKLMP